MRTGFIFYFQRRRTKPQNLYVFVGRKFHGWRKLIFFAKIKYSVGEKLSQFISKNQIGFKLVKKLTI